MKKYFFTLFIAVFFSCNNGLSSKEAEKQKELFSLIKKGMTKDEVIKILGNPANTQIESGNDKTEYFYYSPKANFEFHSDVPAVLFDSTGIVEFSTYGDGD
jgi:outer membrane protein assembly factor BamE (lipoprotein component of BamABCDE complex)